MATKNKFREKNIEKEEQETNSVSSLNDVEEVNVSSNPKNKSKTTKVNSVKTEGATSNSSKAKTASETKISLLQRWNNTVTIYQNERTQKFIGLLLILGGVYLFIALLSYIFTWEQDQDKVLAPLSQLFAIETKVVNWLGKLGALVSHLFMYKGFGVASFILVPVLIIYGIQKILSKQITKPSSFTAKWLFIMLWSSLVLAFLFHDKLFYLGGGYGYILNQELSNVVGTIGALAILVFSLLAFLVLSINLSFNVK